LTSLIRLLLFTKKVALIPAASKASSNSGFLKVGVSSIVKAIEFGLTQV